MTTLRIAFPLLFLSFMACKTMQPIKPAESYSEIVENVPMSTINVPVKVQIKDIETVLNNKLNGVIYEDKDLNDDGLMIRATKSQPIRFSAEGTQFKYRVPVKVWVRKKIPLSSVDAEGEIALNFLTTYMIQPDWSVLTKTELVNHEWIKAPVLKTGLVDINIRAIANPLLNRSKKELVSSIDDQLSKQFDLRIPLRDAWNQLQNPMLISEEYRLWAKLTPASITMTPIKNVNGVLESVIGVEALTDVTFGTQPRFRPNTPLPPFKTGVTGKDDFNVRITTEIPYNEAERMVRQFIVGETFSSGKHKVTVTNIDIYGQYNRMVINTTLTGSYKGNLYLTGVPVFNIEKNRVEMTGLDFELQTKNFLLKSAKWLFNSLLLKKLQQSLVFPLDDNITMIKNNVQNELKGYKVSNNITLHGEIATLQVEKVYLTPEFIKVDLLSNGKLDVDISGF